MQPLVSISAARVVIEGLMLENDAPPTITNFSNATTTFLLMLLKGCLLIRKLMWSKRRLASAGAFVVNAFTPG